MKIIADQNMSLVSELFSPYGEVTLLPGREITAMDVRDADVLLVRSTTRVDQALLADSQVNFVGSATIGVDHVDTGWLNKHGIGFANAPGCNARAVVEYALAALATVVPDWRERRVGVVGCGNVGRRLLAQLQSLDVTCAGYDPLLPDTADLGAGLNAELVDFDTILQSDILCLHTPLTRHGLYPSWHLFDEAILGRLSSDTVLLNAGRGAVIDNRALLRRLEQRADLRVVLDVWEGEPEINLDLLQAVDLATPHIAGYSLAGRVRGTEMVLAAFLAWLGRDAQAPAVTSQPVPLGQVRSLNEAILKGYPIGEDHRDMRAAMAGLGPTGAIFDHLRREYRQRREFSEYQWQAESPEGGSVQVGLAALLAAGGFNVCR